MEWVIEAWSFFLGGWVFSLARSRGRLQSRLVVDEHVSVAKTFCRHILKGPLGALCIKSNLLFFECSSLCRLDMSRVLSQVSVQDHISLKPVSQCMVEQCACDSSYVATV